MFIIEEKNTELVHCVFAKKKESFNSLIFSFFVFFNQHLIVCARRS